MDMVEAVHVGVSADVAQSCVGCAVTRSVGPPDRIQNSMPADLQLLFSGLQGLCRNFSGPPLNGPCSQGLPWPICCPRQDFTWCPLPHISEYIT